MESAASGDIRAGPGWPAEPGGSAGPGWPEAGGGAARSGGHPPDPGDGAPAPRRRARWVRYLVLVVAALVLTAGGGAVGSVLTWRYAGAGGTGTSAAPVAGGSSPASEQLARVAAAVLPSVVSVKVTTSSESMSGSGIILRSDGVILTNDHVVRDAVTGAGELTVTFQDGRTAPAAVVGADAGVDLAVIRAKGVSGLTPATLGSAAGLHVGDTVLAVGSPLGLSGSVTAGIVSALDRDVSVSGGQGLTADRRQSDGRIEDAIQTDTAINPGNSGGALVDAAGRVVGVTTANASVGGGDQAGSIGIGFAIPIDTAYRVASQLMR